jgi:hypothetical protein
MLLFAFDLNGGRINEECLRYQTRALTHIRERMVSPATAANQATLGAILLLANLEVPSP